MKLPRVGSSANPKQLLVQIENEQSQAQANPQKLSRRDALRISVSVAAALGAAVVLPAKWKRAEAGFFIPFLAGAFATYAAWYLAKSSGIKIPGDPEELRLTQTKNPKPSGDRFHDRFNDGFQITNPKYRIPSTYGRDAGFYVRTDGYVRADGEDPVPEFKDLNTQELKRIHQESLNGLHYPCGYRAKPNTQDVAAYCETCERYNGVDPSKLRLDYVRPMNDGKDNDDSQKVAFGVTSRRTGEKDLLISV
jgi:hypothetical protein